MFKSRHLIMAICAAFFMSLGSSACRVQNRGLSSLALARATQALSQSAYIGAQIHFDNRQLERKANPNPIVGRHIYLRYCDSCHASSNKAPSIKGHYDTSPKNESDVNIVRYGLVTMPGFSSKLTNFQIYDVLAYLESVYNEKKIENNDETAAAPKSID